MDKGRFSIPAPVTSEGATSARRTGSAGSQQCCSLRRRALLTGLAGVGASTFFMSRNGAIAAVEQNTLRRRGIGLRASDPERASPGFTLFAPHFVQNRTVYLIDLQGNVVHSWEMPYPPGLSGYLTERVVFQRTHSRGQPAQPFSVQRRRGAGSGLEGQRPLGGPASRPPSSRHPAAQWKRAAPLPRPSAVRYRPACQGRNGGTGDGLGPVRRPSAGRSQ